MKFLFFGKFLSKFRIPENANIESILLTQMMFTNLSAFTYESERNYRER